MKNKNRRFYLFTAQAAAILMLLLMIFVQCLTLSGKINPEGVTDSKKEQETDLQTEGTESQTEEETGQKETEQLMDVDTYVKNRISSMTLEEKCAQLFIITPEALIENKLDKVTAAGKTTREALKKYPVGGLIYFKQNFASKEKTIKMLSQVQNMSEIPLFLCVDEEGGSVARVANSGVFDVRKYDSMGSISSSEEAYLVGKNIGTYLKEIGFNLDFAPIADVNTNPDNPVIGDRAFSSDAQTAADYVSECVKGFADAGILSTLKHFPGHGDTQEDSHTSLAMTERTLKEMKETEFLPFEAGIEAGADLVMVGHIAATEIDDTTPASLSEVMVNGILRGELGYDGLVVTDAMNMGAITSLYSSGETSIKAINAGCDLILMPENFVQAYEAVVNAVKNGMITEDRIDQSVKRILTKKAESGIIDIESTQ